ncbi:MAG: ATP-binding protein [Hamadaea sp.]|nr:ATP-binding protein [Hamadaea sp.]
MESTEDGPGVVDTLIHRAFRVLRAHRPALREPSLVREFGGGYTDAAVAVCDLAETGDGDTRLRGQYVVKVATTQRSRISQADLHQAFCEALPGLARGHVPRLILTAVEDGLQVDLYEVAGYSSRSFRQADEIDFGDLAQAVAAVASDLLTAQLDAAAPPDYNQTAGGILMAWAPQVFDPEANAYQRLEKVAASLGAQGSLLFVHDGEYLPNPHVIGRLDGALGSLNTAAFPGRCHGDLHLRNILVGGARQTRNLHYWLIDVGELGAAPLLFDQAYLEVSAALFMLRHGAARSPLTVLSKLDDIPLSAQTAYINPADQGMLDLVRSIRQATENTLRSLERRRQDVWEFQLPLARIGAALELASKRVRGPGDDQLRASAFLYAAWVSRVLLQRFHPKDWAYLIDQHERSRLVGVPVAPAVTPREFQDFRPFLDDRSGHDLFLLADERFDLSLTKNLGYSAWAAVVDLDPRSDAGGLAQHMRPTLRERRHVTDAGLTVPVDQAGQSTLWLRANGWTSRNEPPPDSLPHWRRTYMPLVRRLVDDVRRRTPNKAARVLVLQSQAHPEILTRILEYLDEAYDGEVTQLTLSSEPVASGRAGLADLLAGIEPLLPTTIRDTEITVPGTRGPVPIEPSNLRWMMSDLEVLHNASLHDQAGRPTGDGFWRGRPPSWVDLQAGLDLPRQLQPRLMEEISKALDGHGPQRILLAHSPGAGGTTLARRIAWDLARTRPVALLKHYSSTTIDRLAELVHLTGTAVLLIIDAGDLSEAERDELQEQISARSLSVVTLRVTRTNARRPVEPRAERDPFYLTDPMKERSEFARLFAPLAESDEGRQMIQRLGTDSGPPVEAQIMSPFFFGLCAFEDGFTGIHAFVRNHVAGLTPEQRKVALYLAIVTRYAQVGIPLHLVRFWVTNAWVQEDADLPPDAELRSLLGDDLRHLTVLHGGALRLMHPRIAERVLIEVLGGSEPGRWTSKLPDAAVELVGQVATNLGQDNFFTRRLLEDLFVRRQQGNDRTERNENFSELIREMPSVESAHYVMQQLTEHCPDEPHFWNHLGRHQIYAMRSDFEKAESYLLRAVQLSNGRDAVHLHQLGQVRRFWIENKVRSVLSENGTIEAADLITHDSPLFSQAMEAFEQARTNAPHTEHGYITPVQLVLFLLEHLVRSSGHDNLPDLIGQGGAISDWAAQQLGAAEDLLDQYRMAKANQYGLQSTFYQRCEADMAKLYGDVDALIDQWRALLADSAERTALGRALARAYIWRARRDWSLLDESELRTIERCMDDAIRNSHPTDSDLRTWFRAYRRLPEYSELRALERFGSVAATTESIEASYYLYVLRFLRWYRGDEMDERAIRNYMDETRRLARHANRQWSFEWLGVDDRPCPLLHFTELGAWSSGFWGRTDQLERVPGVIMEIEDRGSGKVTVGHGRLTAFFSPGDDFRAGRDENRLVDFFLGYSYDGLRAWRVAPRGDWVNRQQTARRAPSQPARRPETGRAPAQRPDSPTVRLTPASIPKPVAVPTEPRPHKPAVYAMIGASPVRPGAASTGAVRSWSTPPTDDELREFIDGLIHDSAGQGGLRLLDLGELLQHTFGHAWYADFRQGRKLRASVESLGYATEQVGPALVVTGRRADLDPADGGA